MSNEIQSVRSFQEFTKEAYNHVLAFLYIERKFWLNTENDENNIDNNYP